MPQEVVDWLMKSKPTDWITAAAAFFGIFGALFSYWSRTSELSAKATLDRFNNYVELNELLEHDPDRIAVLNALANPNKWPEVTTSNRFGFLSLYEQAALMLQSGLVSEDVAFYSYAFDLMRVYEPDSLFWTDEVRKDDQYWSLTKRLADRFNAYAKRYEGKPFPVETFRF